MIGRHTMTPEAASKWREFIKSGIAACVASLLTAGGFVWQRAAEAGMTQHRIVVMEERVLQLNGAFQGFLVDRAADHEILVRIDERVKRLIDDKAALTAEIRALRAMLENR